MSVNIYLNFNGNCREAVELYADAFNVEKQKIMTFGEAPQSPDFPVPESAKDLILHTFLIISGSKIMFSDTMPGMPFVLGNNISITILSKNKDEITSAFDKLKIDGTVNMELQKTFWSDCYGSVKDKFGIEWQLSYDNEGDM